MPRRPVSVLVVVFSDDGYAMLLRRVKPFEFWQSITGSLEADESHADAAARELFEETGLTNEGELRYTGVSRQFVIDPRWRHKFAAGAAENVEFEYRYRLPQRVDIGIHNTEHSEFRWLPIKEAADLVWSWTNRDALRSVMH
ncbi:MAG: dihydroneopterin triphosphate diphosphatase [Gammaproteobacteria bacterium]|nr:dihydroneopterin triphosphate diphosphatase [Gammaproteobacteria bacterium]